MTISTLRWIVKKTARTAMVLGSFISGSLALRRLAGRGTTTIRVITYHRFGDAVRDPWCVSAAAFEEQMRWLAEHKLAVSLEQVERFARGEIDLPNGSVLVTMDDGFSSWLNIATPILQRHAIPAVAYVTTSFVGTTSISGEPYLTWDEVAKLSKAGLTIGSHAHMHRSIAKLTTDEIREEGSRSKALLEQHVGVPVRSFAYPFGMRTDESETTARVLSECGYDSIFIAQHGILRRGAPLARLPRVKVEGGDALWMFKLLCRGGMDGWKLVDDTLWKLQRPAAAEQAQS
ncbi:polysaccharide deacetylase family protein [Rhizobacter sp. J219]|uniref:polysaccharide deacetylase family protein n=1 Tax=Rhizobacter sp. J219 TaxID=2898430 RepID=UPI002150EA65|nr:polysaccharide deacetylase family protein [Rhizobacter sp. J219]MCR5883514.1 polysaccharide deacetylase family protein [Rhizobacter sp. J219]